MPCTDDFRPRNSSAPDPETQVRLDQLTRENDELREALLTLKEGGELTAVMWMKIGREQVKHRQEDLNRLEKQFRSSIADQKAMGREGVATLTHGFLGLVVTADPSRPLEPQLGFDPDSV